MKKYLNIDELKDLLTLSEFEILDLEKSGLLHPVLLSDEECFLKSEVEEIINSYESSLNSNIVIKKKEYIKKLIFFQSDYLLSKELINNVEEIITNLLKFSLDENEILTIIYYYAKKLYFQKNREISYFNILFEDIQKILKPEIIKLLENNDIQVPLNGEDFLGFLYFSLKQLELDSDFPFFSSTKILYTFLKNIEFSNGKVLILNSRTSNIILDLLSLKVNPEDIYFINSNKYENLIARFNLLLYSNASLETIYTHITTSNPLEYSNGLKYNLVISLLNKPVDNVETSEINEKKYFELLLNNSFKSISNLDHLFIFGKDTLIYEQQFLSLRVLLEEKLDLKFAKYYNLNDRKSSIDCVGLDLINKKTLEGINNVLVESNFVHTIKTPRKPGFWLLKAIDEDYSLAIKILSIKNKISLNSTNSTFALGIITGKNEKFITNTPTQNTIPIYSSQNIKSYSITDTNDYLIFTPKLFNQMAKRSYYDANEKLIFKYTSNQLVFAYDSLKRFTINTANILIPRTDYPIKYFLAILNSRTLNFYYRFVFSSNVVSKYIIENLPIVLTNKKIINKIVSLVDKIETEKESQIKLNYFETLDDIIADLYDLDIYETSYLRKKINIPDM
jgi:hypothetical protein